MDSPDYADRLAAAKGAGFDTETAKVYARTGNKRVLHDSIGARSKLDNRGSLGYLTPAPTSINDRLARLVQIQQDHNKCVEYAERALSVGDYRQFRHFVRLACIIFNRRENQTND